MKRLGLIGGVSWHSTAEYYRLINERVVACKGVYHCAPMVISNLNFADVLAWQKEKSDDKLREGFIAEGRRLKAAGCEGFAIASHTLSWLGDLIEADTGLKHISLYQAVLARLRRVGARKVGMTGTIYTLSNDLYRQRYEQEGFEFIRPDEPHLSRTAKIVYKELVRGILKEESKKAFHECFLNLHGKGVDTIVLGCTEIGLLVQSAEWVAPRSDASSRLPLIDMIDAHANECVDWMLLS